MITIFFYYSFLIVYITQMSANAYSIHNNIDSYCNITVYPLIMKLYTCGTRILERLSKQKVRLAKLSSCKYSGLKKGCMYSTFYTTTRTTPLNRPQGHYQNTDDNYSTLRSPYAIQSLVFQSLLYNRNYN